MMKKRGKTIHMTSSCSPTVSARSGRKPKNKSGRQYQSNLSEGEDPLALLNRNDNSEPDQNNLDVDSEPGKDSNKLPCIMPRSNVRRQEQRGQWYTHKEKVVP